MWDKKFLLKFDELLNYEFPMDEPFELTVNYNEVKYEFLVKLASNNKGLICFGSGAYDPKKIKPPIYDRHSWQSEFNQSVIYYNDPTLYEDNYYRTNECKIPKLTLGWGVGRNDEWYLLNIAKIIQTISKKNSIKNTQFFGSSGGGFTSIMLATMFKDSVAVVNNPQIFCKRYYPIHYNNMMEACFGPDFDLDETEKKYSYRLNVVEWIKKKDYIPNIIYIVNLNSKNDIENQLLPFIDEIKFLKNFGFVETLFLVDLCCSVDVVYCVFEFGFFV